MSGKIKVACAWSAFAGAFRRYFPELIVLKSPDEVKSCDLIIFTGGEDISPRLYGRETTYTSYVNNDRDTFECKALEYATKYNKFIYGSCRGHQIINAYLGGSLAQDLYLELKRDHPGYHELEYLDDIKESAIRKYFPEKVNSLHHQGVVKWGNNLYITTTYHGVIESTENNKIISTQFHPELMNDTPSKNFFGFLNRWVTGEEAIDYSFSNSPVMEKQKVSRKKKVVPDFAMPEVPSLSNAFSSQNNNGERIIGYYDYATGQFIDANNGEVAGNSVQSIDESNNVSAPDRNYSYSTYTISSSSTSTTDR